MEVTSRVTSLGTTGVLKIAEADGLARPMREVGFIPLGCHRETRGMKKSNAHTVTTSAITSAGVTWRSTILIQMDQVTDPVRVVHGATLV